MSNFSYYCNEEIQPTLDDVKRDIAKIIGLPKIKRELEAIVDKIDFVEKQAIYYGLRIVSPKLFHMMFVGNSGTGKSMVAKILAKLFYLAGGLPSYNVTEMQGLAYKIKTAEGGILLVDVDREEIKPQILEKIISAMDKGKTLVIFAGTRKRLNHYVNFNRDLYNKFSVGLEFNDLTREELAEMLYEKMKMNEEEEDHFTHGYKLDSSCTAEMIAKIIGQETREILRNKLNGYLVEQILEDARRNLKSRVDPNAGLNDQRTITLENLYNGVRSTAKRYKQEMTPKFLQPLQRFNHSK